MKENNQRHFRTLFRFLFCLLVGMILIIPISGFGWMLAAKQDVLVSPASMSSEDFWARQTTAPTAQVAPSASEKNATLATSEGWFIGQSGNGAAVVSGNHDPFAKAPRLFSQTGPASIGIGRTANSDPMQKFVERIRNAKDEEKRQRAIDQARAALEKKYDNYVAQYQSQVDDLEERLQKLRDQLDKRKEVKNKLVNLKLEMITSQADGFGWPGDDDPAGRFKFSNPSAAISASGFNMPTPVQMPRSPRASVSPPAAVNINPLVTPRSPIAGRTGFFAGRPGATQLFTNSRSFESYFSDGIELLNAENYGEFLDRYMKPESFRDSLKSATLDEVSNKFANTLADNIRELFELALEDPVKRYNPETSELIWEFDSDQNRSKRLKLTLGKNQNWYLDMDILDQGR